MRELSPDWQFGIAYNAALKLCTILLYASGFRPEKNLAHYRTLAALPLILGNERKNDADYLDTSHAIVTQMLLKIRDAKETNSYTTGWPEINMIGRPGWLLADDPEDL